MGRRRSSAPHSLPSTKKKASKKTSHKKSILHPRSSVSTGLQKKSAPSRAPDRLIERNDFHEAALQGELHQSPKEILGLTDHHIDTLYGQAIQYLALHETQQAIRGFRLLCSLCPYDADFWLGLGRALREDGQSVPALSALLMVETIDPSYFEAYEEAIQCCLEMGSFSEARRILKRYKKHKKVCEQVCGASLQHKLNELDQEISLHEQSG